MTHDENDILALAERHGVELEYEDTWGRIHRTSEETAKKILTAKSAYPAERRIEPESWTYVADRGDPEERIAWTFEPRESIEGSRPERIELTISGPGDDRASRRSDYSGDHIEIEWDNLTGRARISVPMPEEPLPIGDYRVSPRIEGGDRSAEREGALIVCPKRAYMLGEPAAPTRIAGVGVALYGLRSERNWGIGDFTDLIALLDWAKDEAHVDFVGLNPLHALFNRRPYNISPYMPSSRFFHNFIYLDITALPEFEESSDARSFAESPETLERIERLRTAALVDYEGCAGLKLEVLRKVFRSFMDRGRRNDYSDPRWTEFSRYVDEQGDYLHRYAIFCTLEEHFRTTGEPIYVWTEWPAEYHDPESEAVELFAEERKDDVLFWKYVQWRTESQLARCQEYALDKGMLIGLYHDEALAVDHNGADSWAFNELFHEGFRVGAPPDAFAPQGQDWGFAPPNRDKLREAAYEPFRRKLRANCKYGGALRIDHVMQIHRLFWIPDGRKPADGVYVRDSERDLLNVIALESLRNETIIIGEDLGTVPPRFRERLMDKGVLSYRLFYFERDQGNNLIPYHRYPERALVSVTTHDLPTLAGFWTGRDIDLRRRLGLLNEEAERDFRADRTDHKAKIIERLVRDGVLPDHTAHAAWESPFPTEDLHNAVLRFLFNTPSRMVIINQEDVFLDERQQNLPGTTTENNNWVTKMRYSIEQLRNDPDALRFAQRFRDRLEESGRASRPSRP